MVFFIMIEIIKYLLVFSPAIIVMFAIHTGLTDNLTDKFTLVK